MQETWVQALVQEDPLEKEMATHSSILSWKIPWTEEPGGLRFMGSQKLRHYLVTKLKLKFLSIFHSFLYKWKEYTHADNENKLETFQQVL